jgi:nucleoside-diphosphate-sugar epimerase
VLGATSIVGSCLLRRLQEVDRRVAAFSRQQISTDNHEVNWYQTDDLPSGETIPYWVCLAPIWVVTDYLNYFEQSGAKRIVSLSSTSRFSKSESSEPKDRAIAERLAEAEEKLSRWAESKGIDWYILRPTLIYGYGRDGNISEIARMIRRYRFFPLFGKGLGLRQPVHADDVAQACEAALDVSGVSGRSLNLSGGETLTYREMVGRIFTALGQRPRFISVPLPLFRLGVFLLRLFPRYRHWHVSMAERMNRDMVFEHDEARRLLGFDPRGFVLKRDDLPLD